MSPSIVMRTISVMYLDISVYCNEDCHYCMYLDVSVYCNEDCH